MAATFTFWTLAGLGLLVAGLTLFPTLAEWQNAQTYQRARECSGAAVGCFSVQAATLGEVKVTGASRSRTCHVVVNSSLGRRGEFMEFRSACDVLSRGDRVRIAIWQQRITAIAPAAGGYWRRTLENPLWTFENDRIGFIGGLVIAAAGLLLSFLLWRRYRWPGGPRPQAFGRWTQPPPP